MQAIDKHVAHDCFQKLMVGNWVLGCFSCLFQFYFISHKQILRIPATLGAPRKGCLKALRAPNALSRAAGYVGESVQRRVDLKGGESKPAWTRL